MGKSRAHRTKGKQSKGGRKVRAKRSAKRGRAHQERVLEDCLAGRITGAGPENHMLLYDNLRGPSRPRLALDYFVEVCQVGVPIDPTPYIIDEEPSGAEVDASRLNLWGGGARVDTVAPHEDEDEDEDEEIPVAFPVRPPKKGKGKRKKKVHFAKGRALAAAVKDLTPSRVEALPDSVKTSFGSAVTAVGEEVPDRIAEPLRPGSSQYSYPAVETVNRFTIKKQMARARAGHALTEEDEYCTDISTPAQQDDIDRCLEDLFASEKRRRHLKEAEEEEADAAEEVIRIAGGSGEGEDTDCLSRGYSTLRKIHPRYADWLLADMQNLGFHQLFDWTQAMMHVYPIQKRCSYALADFFMACENRGGVPWKFSFSNATKIDTIVVPCSLFSLRVRMNTYTEREQELRIKMAAVEEELLQKKSDLRDVTQDYLTCLMHLGIPGNVTDTEASSIKTIDEAREHFDFPVVLINAQFEMMLR